MAGLTLERALSPRTCPIGQRNSVGPIGMLVSNLHRSDQELLSLLKMCVAGQTITSMEEAQALLLRNFRVGKDNDSECANWLTAMARDMLAPVPFREVFVILALFLPQLTFLEGTRAQQNLWASPAVKQRGLQVDIMPTVSGLKGMHEYHISFPTWSTVAVFCSAQHQHLPFDQLYDKGSNEVHMGCQVGKVYRLVLQNGVLAFATQARKKSSQNREEPPYDRIRRLCSPRSWEVALIPFPVDFAPLPTLTETGRPNCPFANTVPSRMCSRNATESARFIHAAGHGRYAHVLSAGG